MWVSQWSIFGLHALGGFRGVLVLPVPGFQAMLLSIFRSLKIGPMKGVCWISGGLG